eukprot:TRINITY_DN40714_c0_g1_i1.p1 TRINITY_DN40714_c0_g1~~TRINITY_DN40714_c0_g1_i1.p1  ORF type:complete len:967 (+),score=196.11 TRINITY_DN40714_c0_g1_i1:113-3013(+)
MQMWSGRSIPLAAEGLQAATRYSDGRPPAAARRGPPPGGDQALLSRLLSLDVGAASAAAEEDRQIAEALSDRLHTLGQEPRKLTPLLKSLGRQRRATVAAGLLRVLRNAGLQANVIHYNAVINGCASSGHWQLALQLLHDMPADGIPWDTIVLNAALSVCEKSGQWQPAMSLLGEARSRQVPVDTITFNAALSCCHKGGGQWEQTVALLDLMASLGLQSDVITANAAIGGCAEGQQWRRALALWAAAPRRDAVTHTAMLTAFARCGRWEETLGLLEELRGLGVGVDDIMFTTAIAACERSGAWEVAIDWLEQSGTPVSVPRLNAVLNVCASAYQWETALQLFARAPDQRTRCDTLSYNCLMSSLGKGQQWALVLHYLDDMEASKIQRTTSSFNAAIAACERVGQWQWAVHLLQVMEEGRVDPDYVTFSAASSACERQGSSATSMALLDQRLALGRSSGGPRPRLRRRPHAPRGFLAHANSLGQTGLDLRRFLRASSRPPHTSFRVNTFKADSSVLERLSQAGLKLHPVPWQGDSFFVAEAPPGISMGRLREHLTGQIYFQESTSMVPAQALICMLSRSDAGKTTSEPVRVLDVCSAPGSKTTQLACFLEQHCPQGGILVANEEDERRCSELRVNLLKAGVSNSLVTCMDGRELGDLASSSFDAVLVDVPCSCEGNERKDPGALLRSYGGENDDGEMPEQHRPLVTLQWQLLQSAWQALRPGGFLVYSTCTQNRWENEDQCHRLLGLPLVDGCRAVAVDVSQVLELPFKCIESDCGSLRFWPQSVDAEGFFVSCFKKEVVADGVGSAGQQRNDATGGASAGGRAGLRQLEPEEQDEVSKLLDDIGFRPAGLAGGMERLAVDDEQNVWLLPAPGRGLDALTKVAMEPGLLVAEASDGSGGSRFALSEDFLLVAGDRAAKLEMSDRAWEGLIDGARATRLKDVLANKNSPSKLRQGGGRQKAARSWMTS